MSTETTATRQTMEAWHSLTLAEVFQQLDTTDAGLDVRQAQQRLAQFGPNQLPEQPPTTVVQIALRQFYSPLIYILILAAIVSLLLGDLKDAGFIVLVLGINAIVGGYQEWKAEQSSQSLKQLLKIRTTVLRDGEPQEVPAEEIVPGDIVWLESGNRISGDLRLVTSNGLEVDESLLTGESLPVAKNALWKGNQGAAIGDRLNMAYAGSTVTRGRGVGLVVATGIATNVGQLALDVTSTPGGKPPLLQRMERFTNVIGIATLCIATVIGVLGVGLGRYAASEMFLFVVALAVSAIPEGLPVAMTVALAIATTRMARRGVIVRRLTAVEGLGSCSLVATDKTGTLTVNELTVQRIVLAEGGTFLVSGEGFTPNGAITDPSGSPITEATGMLAELITAGVRCNEASLTKHGDHWQWRGDAVDVALLTLGVKSPKGTLTANKGLERVRDIPFESERQFAATYWYDRQQQVTRVYVKGALERLLPMCELDAERAARIEAAALGLASAGYRVLAMASACQPATRPPHPESVDTDSIDAESTSAQLPNQLHLLGLVGMIDPLRPGVRQAVEQCHRSGVEVTMVTGDHAVTALAIAKDLGLATHESQVLTGPQLEKLSATELRSAIATTRVFARVAPRQKLQIVEAARQANHFVAVTGDGVNDAPALRTANIGVAMGKAGTDVAREAAELVISDDNFSTIVAGIEEGRIAYDNVRKVIYLLVSTGAAELVLMGLAILTGLPLPLLPVQILWLNLVTNGIQDVALAFEPGEGNVLQRKPRPKQEPIFNRLMIERTLVAALVIGLIGFFAFKWMLDHGWDESAARNVLLLMMVLFENFHIGNCRSETQSAFVLSPLRSPLLLIGAGAALCIHLAVMHLPFMQPILGTAPVNWQTALTIALASVLIVPALELHKLAWHLRSKQLSAP